jgi:hypothetical protein
MSSNVVVWQLIFKLNWTTKLQLIVQMCKPCTHIIIVQTMINNASLHSIIIYKHEMNLKLYALIFKVEKCITKTIFLHY